MFHLSATNELVVVPTPIEFTTFFDVKRAAYTSLGTKNFFKIYGTSRSCNSTVLNIVYEYTSMFTNLVSHPTIVLSTK